MPLPCLWCIAGQGPCSCGEDCGERPSGWLSGCPLAPGAGEWPAEAWPLGPLASRIWAVSALLDPLTAGELAGEGAACGRRAGSGRSCLLCGGAARVALVSRLAWPAPLPPRWVDLCHRCMAAVRREFDGLPVDFSETSDGNGR